jgi:hypothetical protein
LAAMSRHYVREVELRRALRSYDTGPAAPKPARHRWFNLLAAFRRHGGRTA